MVVASERGRREHDDLFGSLRSLKGTLIADPNDRMSPTRMSRTRTISSNDHFQTVRHLVVSQNALRTSIVIDLEEQALSLFLCWNLLELIYCNCH